MKRLLKEITLPERLVTGTFLLAISLGTLFLKMPFSSTTGHISLIDALFTATSATCVTGLTVLDTGKDFTLIGQIIILCLIQIGGLGTLTFSILLFQFLKGNMPWSAKLAFESTFTFNPLRDFYSYAKRIVVIAIVIELLGMLSLWLYWKDNFGQFLSFFLALFHSISAFCNAGFSPFSDSLARFRGDIFVNVTVCVLIILGGIGFLVIEDLMKFLRKRQKLTLHSKLVLVTTFWLIIGGAALLWLSEHGHALKGLGLKEKVMIVLFHSISARTAGFSTFDLASFRDASLYVLVFLMFVGASPGSCGGGIKTTNLALLWVLVYNRLKGRVETVVWRRTVPSETVGRSLSITIGSSLFLALFLGLVLFSLPPGLEREGWSFIRVLFELTSAFGTVGLSVGLSPKLSDFHKLLFVIIMFIGRVGLLTATFSLARKKVEPLFRYAEENIMV